MVGHARIAEDNSSNTAEAIDTNKCLGHDGIPVWVYREICVICIWCREEFIMTRKLLKSKD